MSGLVDIVNNLDSTERGIHFYLDNRFVTYVEYKEHILSYGGYLKNVGVSKGDKVIVNLQPTLEHTALFLSLILIGAVPVSVKPKFGDERIYKEYLHNLAKKQDVNFFHRDVNPDENRFASIKPEKIPCDESGHCEPVSNEETAFIQFTSGSTSDPKPVEITHANIAHNLEMITKIDERSFESVGFNFLPLNHDMGLIGGFLSNLLYQNTLHLTSIDHFLRRMPFYLKRIRSENVDVTAMPNFILSYLAKRLKKMKRVDDSLLSSLTSVYVGAEPIRKNTIEEFLQTAEKFGFQSSSLVFCYGMAETTLLATAHRFSGFDKSFDKNRHGEYIACVGKPVDGMRLHIHRTKEEVGEIYINGASVVPSLATAEYDSKEYLPTGDIGYIKNENLYIYGRKKDMAIINGENIYMIDVENYLIQSLSELTEYEYSAIAVPCGESFAVLLNGKKELPQEICEHIANRVFEKFSIKPARVQFVSNDLLKKTTSGKIMKEATIRSVIKNGDSKKVTRKEIDKNQTERKKPCLES